METDICPAKHLGMNQPTRGTRLSTRRLLPSRQGFHASVLRRQHGHHAGDCPRLAEEEQARQDALPDDTARHLKHACHTVFDHVARSDRHQHVRNSKISPSNSF